MIVSVIIPTRDRPELLACALNGVGCQKFKDIEVVVVDDGSSDENALRNKSLTDAMKLQSRYLYLEKEPLNGHGPSTVRNHGVSNAAGDLISFCDDDDYWVDPKHLEVAVEKFSENPGLDYFFADQRAELEGVRKSESWLPHLICRLDASRFDRHECALVKAQDLLAEGHFPHLNTTIVRKSFFEKLGGLWEQARYSEDLDFFVRATDAASEIIFRNQVVSVHNIPVKKLASNASTRLSAMQKQNMMVRIGDHLLETCVSDEARGYARNLRNNAHKHLAQMYADEATWAKAAEQAKLALSNTPGWKWWLYTRYLSVRAAVSRGAEE